MKRGNIVKNNVRLEDHEQATVEFLLRLGHNIELIPPSSTPGAKTPDFLMDGVAWEAKSPTGKSIRMTIDRILHRAARQSQNIVLDLRRMKNMDEEILPHVEQRFYMSRRIRKSKVITTSKRVLDYVK